jgi:hypothetical protein
MTRMNSSRWLAIVGLLAAAPFARGEVFLLKSGGRLEGDQLNPNRQPTEPYQLRTALGVRLDLAPATVARVIVKTDVQKQYEELLPKMPNTAEGHWLMAGWCKEASLLDERKKHLAEVIAREPDHEEARAALGYSRFGSKWMTQDEYMTSLGYIRSNGRYRLRQEIELAAKERSIELASKALRQDIRSALKNLGTKDGADAIARLQAIRDPLAAPALAEILVDKSQPASTRMLCLDILGKMQPGLVDGVLIKLAMEEDNRVGDRALEELVRSQSPAASAFFIKELESKDNRRVLRAAACLQRLGDKEATLPLINALVTKHEYIVTSGSGGPVLGPGGMSAGSKTEKIKKDHNNDTVLSTLNLFHQGVNHGFDEDAWKRWYIETFTSTEVDLRREE